MRDPDIYTIANNPDLVMRATVRIADTAQYITGGGGDQTLKVNAGLALLSPGSQIPKFIWSLALNPDIQKHYNGTAVLAEGDSNTPGTLTYLINYVISSKIGILWA